MYSPWSVAMRFSSTPSHCAGSSYSSTAYFIESLLWFGFDSTTNGLLRFRHPLEHCQRPGFVEPFVEVPALRALDAGGASVLARAAFEHAHGVCDPALELLEAALGDADAAGVAVVDEHRRLARVLVDVRREAADVPAVAHRPEREDRDHRVLGGVQGREQRRHLLEPVQMRRAGDVPDRLRLERRRGEV